jgi:predicted regulator of Ras-like GTPase activity (Roadblock/LC7/MglB family)
MSAPQPLPGWSLRHRVHSTHVVHRSRGEGGHIPRNAPSDTSRLDTPLSLCYITAAFPLESKYFSTVCREHDLAKSRTEHMVNRLRDLQASSPDVEASAVVSVDGLTMASALPSNVEEDRVSAMSAAMLSLGERIASELGRGVLDQVYIKGESGFVILMSVGSEAVLTVLARQQAKLGLIFLDMRRAAEDLADLL